MTLETSIYVAICDVLATWKGPPTHLGSAARPERPQWKLLWCPGEPRESSGGSSGNPGGANEGHTGVCEKKPNCHYGPCPFVPIWTPWSPRHAPGFSCQVPKIVFGHNLHHMAPFPDPRPGFCMVFRRATFIFLAPGTTSWTQDPIFGLGSQVGLPTRPGRCFGQKWDP